MDFTAVPTYPVTFNESGLPSGTDWSVVVRSESSGSTPWPIRLVETGNTTSLTVSLPNGTYCYRVLPVPGFSLTAGTGSGPLSISGAPPPGVSLVFVPAS